jgi:hypothetical protein
LTRPKASKPIGYWNIWENVKQEIHSFIFEFGTYGVMPTYSQLVSKGRNDLTIAIMRRHGGFSTVAEKLGLKVVSKRTNNYWDNWDNVKT